MRYEYVNEYANQEFENYKLEVSQGRKIEDCLSNTNIGLNNKVSFHNGDWFSFTAKDVLLKLYTMTIKEWPNKKDEIETAIKDALKSLGYDENEIEPLIKETLNDGKSEEAER